MKLIIKDINNKDLMNIKSLSDGECDETAEECWECLKEEEGWVSDLLTDKIFDIIGLEVSLIDVHHSEDSIKIETKTNVTLLMTLE